jgi:S1-C subfamily serine protease
MASSSAGVSIIDDRSEAVELYRELNLSTCLIRAETGLGSGVILSRDLVLTAAHVVSHSPIVADDNGNPKRGEPEIEKCVIIKNAPGIPFLAEAKVIKIDYELDLAVLRLARVWPFTIAKLATFDPYLYQKAWASGHPHGVTDTEITEGRIQDLWDDGFIRYSSPTTFGNSGGPVFIREDGRFKVSSIVQRVHTEGGGVAVNHLGLGALPENVRDFMRDYSGE